MLTRYVLAILCLFFANASIAQKLLGKFSSVTAIEPVGSKIFFFAIDDQNGEEPWVSDGTPEGTKILKDINPGYASSSTQQSVAFKGRFYFSASSPEFDGELWRSDGTSEGTVIVKDLTPKGQYNSSTDPRLLTVYKDALYFTGSGGELFKTDGTAEGTSLFDKQQYSRISTILVAGDYLYYYINGGITRTNGADKINITLPEHEVNYYYKSLYTAGDKLYLLMTDTYSTKIKLWGLNNGTTEWQVLTEQFLTGDSEIGNFTASNGKLFFTTVSNTSDLWVTNGTADGTIKLASFAYAEYESGSEIENLVDFNGVLFFRGSTSSSKALWKSDGTVAGTVQVSSVVMTGPEYILNPPAAANGLLYFCGDNSQYVGNRELWTTDGTASGTKLFADLLPGAGSAPYLFTSNNDKVYFVTGNQNNGARLWSSSPAPLLNVAADGGSDINSGSSISLSAVLLDDCSKKQIVIKNYGHKELIVSEVRITGSDFYIEGPIAKVIAPDDKSSFNVYFNPISKESKTATISILTNDAAGNFTIQVAGQSLSSDSHGFCEAFQTNDLVKTLVPELAATSIVLSNNSVGEQLPAGTVVGSLSVPNQTVGFSLLAGVGDEGNDQFVIENNQLKTKRPLSEKERMIYSIRVKAEGLNTSEETIFTISVLHHDVSASLDCEKVFERLDYGINDIAINSVGHLFAATSDGGILVSKDEGQTWSKNDLGISQFLRLNKIIFRKQTGFMTGDNTLFKSDDNGGIWFPLVVPFKAGYTSSLAMFFFDDMVGFVGNSQGEILQTKDGGKSWVTKRDAQSSDRISSLSFWDENNGVASMGWGNLSKTTDGGKTWIPLNTSAMGFSPNITAVWFLDAKNGFVTTTRNLYETTDGGDTWLDAIGYGYDIPLTGLKFIDDNTGYAFGSDSGPLLFKTSDSGKNWSPIANNTPGPISGVAQSSNGKLFVSHRNYYYNGNGRLIESSSDEGTNWTELNSSVTTDFYCIDFPTVKVGYLSGGNVGYKTTDGGHTWTKLNWSKNINRFHFFTESKGWLTDGYSLYETIDGGETLTEIFDAGTDLPRIGSIYVFNENTIMLFSSYAIYSTQNGGANWTLVSEDGSYSYYDFHFISPSVGYWLELFGGVKKTTDGGLHWEDVFVRDPNSSNAHNTIFFIDETTGFKAGNSGLLAKTTDGGISWNQIYALIPDDIVDLHFYDSQTGSLVTRSGNVYKTTNGGTIWNAISALGSFDQKVSVANFRRDEIFICGTDGFIAKVTTPPAPPTIPGYIFGKNYVCKDDIVTFIAPPVHNGSYHWSSNANIVRFDDNQIDVQFSSEGDYTVNLMSNSACGNSEVRTITVKALDYDTPVISGTTAATAGAVDVSYTVTNPQDGLTYQWTASGSASLKNETSNPVLVTWKNDIDEGTVSVIQSDAISGCRVRGDLNVTLMVTGLEDLFSNSISIYPNPTPGEFTVQSSNPSTLNLRIYNTLGQEYFIDQIIPKEQKSFSLRTAPAGIYIVEAKDSDSGKLLIKKIVKK